MENPDMNRFVRMMLALSFLTVPFYVQAGMDYSEIAPEPTQTTSQTSSEDLLDKLIESSSDVPSITEQSSYSSQMQSNYTDSTPDSDSIETPLQETGFRPDKETLRERMVFITGQRENHLLINVGDVVYLLTLETTMVRQQERYIIFKQVQKVIKEISNKPVTWFEPVGKLKILETNQPLSLGRVIAARGIIQKGDFIFLGKGAHE